MSDLKYDSFIPTHPIRKKFYLKLYKLFVKYNEIYNYNIILDELQKISINIEKSIFNYILNFYNIKWDIHFENLYINKFVIIYSNLNPESYVKNINLLHKIFNHSIDPIKLVHFNSSEIFPEKYNENLNTLKINLNEQIIKKDIPDGIFKCNKCKKYKTTYYELQTRSAKIIGWKSTLPITSWICYWKNSLSPSFNTQVLVNQ